MPTTNPSINPSIELRETSGRSLIEVSMVITKASVQADGSMRWQAVVSDTSPDNTGESTSIPLFQDWINRVENDVTVDWLPPPRKPFLGISHYSDLEGYGEAGVTDKMYIDGKQFKASGVFYDNPVGRALFNAVKSEMDLVKRGSTVSKPIRISAAWWDIQHTHGPFIFERKSLTDTCPMCVKGEGNKQYLAGQPDHFAGTRVPINPRTNLLTEKADIMTITKREDAASIVGEELAEELDVKEKARLVGKSEAGLVVKAKAKPPVKEEDDKAEGEQADDEEEEDAKGKKKPPWLNKAFTMADARALPTSYFLPSMPR